MNDERHLFLGSAGRRALLLLGVLFALLAVLVPDARAANHQEITAIDRAKGLVTAKVTATGRVFQFQVKDAALLKSLKVGQKISADLKAMTVTLPGAKPGAKAVQLKIMKADPVAAPAGPPTGATSSAATSGSGSGASKKKKTSGGGLDSLDPNSVKVTPAPEPSTATAIRGKPAHEAQPGRAGATASPPPNPAAQVAGAATTALPHPLKDLRVSPYSPAGMPGGSTVSGTVELHQAPGPGGVTVALESSDPEVAEVPSQVTVTGGATSAETGPMYIARFDITTRAVRENKSVTIRARVGVQTLEAILRFRAPRLTGAHLELPYHGKGYNECGDEKATVTFSLDGPAPSGGVEVRVRIYLYQPGGEGETKTIPSGNRSGSVRVATPWCNPQAHPNGCDVKVMVNILDPIAPGPSGFSAQTGGSCRST